MEKEKNETLPYCTLQYLNRARLYGIMLLNLKHDASTWFLELREGGGKQM